MKQVTENKLHALNTSGNPWQLQSSNSETPFAYARVEPVLLGLDWPRQVATRTTWAVKQEAKGEESCRQLQAMERPVSHHHKRNVRDSAHTTRRKRGGTTCPMWPGPAFCSWRGGAGSWKGSRGPLRPKQSKHIICHTSNLVQSGQQPCNLVCVAGGKPVNRRSVIFFSGIDSFLRNSSQMGPPGPGIGGNPGPGFHSGLTQAGPGLVGPSGRAARPIATSSHQDMRI